MCGKKPTAICRDDHVAFFCPFRVQWRQIPEKQGDFTPLNRLVHRKRGQGRRQGRIRRKAVPDGTGRHRQSRPRNAASRTLLFNEMEVFQDFLKSEPTRLTTRYSTSANCMKCALPHLIFCCSFSLNLFKSTSGVPVSFVSATK